MNSSLEPRQNVQDKAYREGQLDSEIAMGPKESRTCRDQFCLLLFVISWIASLILAQYAFSKGDPNLLLRPTDSSGNTCGYPGSGLESYSYIYFMDYAQLNATVCVRSCPSTHGGKTLAGLDCYPNGLTKDCKERVYGTNKQQIQLYDTLGYASIVCLPSRKTFELKSTMSAMDIEPAFKASIMGIFYDDVEAARPVLTFVPLAAIILGFIFIIFLRNCAGCVVWSFITISLVGLVTFGFLCFNTLSNPENNIGEFGILKDTPRVTLKFLAFGSWSLAAVYVLALLCLCNRIRLTVAILRCSAEFVREVPSALFAPVVSLVLFGGYLLYWLAVSVYLYSTGDIKNNEQGYSFKEITWSANHRFLLLFHVFHGYWNFFFIFGTMQFAIALMCCKWYFCYERRYELQNLLLKAYSTVIFYHLGSIAFGSILLTSLSTIKAVLAYFYNQLNSLNGNPAGRCVKYLYACIFCFLDCFERLIQFLTRHSYTQMAMSGKNFCSSSKDAFYLVVRNAARFGLVHEFGKIFVGFGQLCITSFVAVLTYLSITKLSSFQDSVQYPLLPVAFAAAIGYVIGTIFMLVYGITADAIIHCYCVDEELNPNNKYAPLILRDFIEQHAGGSMLIREAELSVHIK